MIIELIDGYITVESTHFFFCWGWYCTFSPIYALRCSSTNSSNSIFELDSGFRLRVFLAYVAAFCAKLRTWELFDLRPIFAWLDALRHFEQQQQQLQQNRQLFNCLNRHLQRFLAMTSCSFWFLFFFLFHFGKIGFGPANLFAILPTCFVRRDLVAIKAYGIFSFVLFVGNY